LNTALSNKSYLKNQIYFTNYDFTLWSNFTFWHNDTLTGDQIQQEEARKIYGYKGNYVRVDELGRSTLKSEFGIGIRQDEIPRLLLFNNFERNNTLDTLAYGQVGQTNISLFFNEMIRFSPKFSMSIGLRFDHFILKYVDDTQPVYTVFSDNAGIFNPKLNLYYNLNSDFQLYLRAGSGFHSNDARTLYEKRSDLILPRAIGADFGTFVKPVESILLNLAVWTLYLEEELVYVGDEAIVEPSDETIRLGFDISLRYQMMRNLYLDFDYNYAWGRFINEPEGANYIPLAPTHTSMGGITYKPLDGFGASLRYRYVSDRPANEMNTVRALGSTVIDLALSYRLPRVELFFKIENLFNVEWNEAQFDTESRLRGPNDDGSFTGQLEPNSFSELHYTPGSPIFIRGGLVFFL
jgi:outer membrane receptor protein involved in Fe transport